MSSTNWLRAYPLLFVDDEPDNLLVLRATFSRRFQVFTAADATAALAVLERHPIAVLVTDQRMPGMSGVALCALVRRRWPTIRRVVLTAWGDRDAALAAINEGGVHAFLDKPWQAEVLERVLVEAIGDAALESKEQELRGTLLRRERQLATDALARHVAADLEATCARAQRELRRLLAVLTDMRSTSGDAAQLEAARATARAVADALDALQGQQRGLADAHAAAERSPIAIEHIIATAEGDAIPRRPEVQGFEPHRRGAEPNKATSDP